MVRRSWSSRSQIDVPPTDCWPSARARKVVDHRASEGRRIRFLLIMMLWRRRLAARRCWRSARPLRPRGYGCHARGAQQTSPARGVAPRGHPVSRRKAPPVVFPGKRTRRFCNWEQRRFAAPVQRASARGIGGWTRLAGAGARRFDERTGATAGGGPWLRKSCRAGNRRAAAEMSRRRPPPRARAQAARGWAPTRSRRLREPPFPPRHEPLPVNGRVPTEEFRCGAGRLPYRRTLSRRLAYGRD